jgi:hypothetical protein
VTSFNVGLVVLTGGTEGIGVSINRGLWDGSFKRARDPHELIGGVLISS